MINNEVCLIVSCALIRMPYIVWHNNCKHVGQNIFIYIPPPAQLVSNPHQFDVMVMPNLYGNIVSNIGAGLVGGAGVCPGRNIGREYVLFEQGARHTGLDLAFQNTANPTAMLLSATLMLRHLG